MKVILQSDVAGQGKKGQVVNVSDGYARNYLLPKGLAVEASEHNMGLLKAQDEARRHREQVEREKAKELAEQLKKLLVTINVKAGAGGKLFGAVTSKEISDRLKEQYGIEIDKRRINLPEPIKNYGKYDVEIKLHPEVAASLKVVVSEP